MNPFVPSARLGFRRLRIALAASLLFGWLAVPACSSSNAGDTKLTTKACELTSDCSPPYICAFGSCSVKCRTSADCEDGGSCITDGKNAICQSAADKNTACDKQADCHAPLACASDYRCRNLCDSDADCNVLGITGRLCAEDANGVNYCAEPSEVSPDGKLISTPPAGAPDSGVTEPATGGGGGMSSGGMSSIGGDGGSSGEMNTEAGDGGAAGQLSEPVGGAGGQSVGGSSGTGGAATVQCVPGCAQGKVCVEGSCVQCGSSNQACCEGQTCSANLSCTDAGQCSCGDANQACCGGAGCNPGTSCDTSGSTPMCNCGKNWNDLLPRCRQRFANLLGLGAVRGQ